MLSTTTSTAPDSTARTPRKRRHRNKSHKQTKAIPSLKEFMHRHKILKQYRTYQRAIQCIPTLEEQRAARDEIRQEFKRQMSETDPITIQMCVQSGEARLKQVTSMVGYQPKTHQEEEPTLFQTKENANKQPEETIQEDDHYNDRGRVGEGWPWQRSE